MTAQTHRHLVNLEILISDIEILAPGDLATAPHLRLLDSIRLELTALEASAQNETQQGFQKLVGATTLKQGLKDKRMLTIYNRLLGYILQHWRASTKIDEIIDSQFDNHADERLELLRTKSIRAKSQCKTIMLAMGNCDANYFLTLFGLQQEAWLVQV